MSNNQPLWRLKELNYKSWHTYFPKVKFANLLQSWEYGEAKKCQGWKPVRFLLIDHHGRERGLLQVLVKGLPIIGGVARINRGPILFQDPFKTALKSSEVFCIWATIRKLAIKNCWWYLSCAPELPDDDNVTYALQRVGYKKIKNKVAWGSIRLDLNSDINIIFTRLHGKWRNLLRKGQKANVIVEEVIDSQEALGLVEIYNKFQKEKNFIGIQRKMLLALLENVGHKIQIKIYKTLSKNSQNASGFVFIAQHGDTATYLLGWTSSEGRAQQANYLLLWKSIELAKNSNIKWFDLGGYNDSTPKGIKHFKKGIGGLKYTITGEYKRLL